MSYVQNNTSNTTAAPAEATQASQGGRARHGGLQGEQRFAELDGLRALAVVAVILFHCEVTGLLSAGFFGVDIFFMI